MNVPNMLTACRFGLIPLYVHAFFFGYPKTALGIVLLAGGTDVLDGYLARKRGETTQLGAMLDPLADKLMMLAVVVSLLWKQWIPWQAAALMALRDLGMIFGSAFFHFRGKTTVPANTMGKLTTVLFYAAILLVFFHSPYGVPLLWVAIGFSFVASGVYIVLFRNLNQRKKSI